MKQEYQIAIVFFCVGIIAANVLGIADYRHGWDDSKNDSKVKYINTNCSELTQPTVFLPENAPKYYRDDENE